MTTAVMTPDEEPAGHSAPVRPIVLALNCDKASRYLIENEVLHCLGLDLVRIDIHIDPNYVSVDRASEHMGEIHRVYPDLTWNDMDRNVHEKAWLTREVEVFIDDGIKDHPHARWFSSENVKVVLIGPGLLEGDGNVLHELLTGRYPSAACFVISEEQHKRPVRYQPVPLTDALIRVTGAPPCATCGTKMRPAGDTYVCEGCGSTKPISD